MTAAPDEPRTFEGMTHAYRVDAVTRAIAQLEEHVGRPHLSEAQRSAIIKLITELRSVLVQTLEEMAREDVGAVEGRGPLPGTKFSKQNRKPTSMPTRCRRARRD
jgi:hypothetical protein